MSKSMGLDSLRLTVQAIMQMLRKKADANKVVSSVNGTVPDKNGNVVIDIPEGSGLPEDGAPHQQLVTDAEGNAKWEDRDYYKALSQIFYVEEQTVTVSDYMGPLVAYGIFTEGNEYTVTFDDVVYKCVAYSVYSMVCIGNSSLLQIDGYGQGEPFFMMVNGDNSMIVATDGEHTVEVYGYDYVYHYDMNYIPYYTGDENGEIFNDRNTNIARSIYSHAEGSNTTAQGKYSHAEGYQTTAGGESSHSEGCQTTAGGVNSHAEGYYTTASGNYSHAEGNSTTAKGEYSHAEGQSTKATGSRSHAEGGSSTTASGTQSHAEGGNTTASGVNSHAEGAGTTASSEGSHAEGYRTTASGEYSHAEGYQTTASGNYSHAEGQETLAYGSYSHAEGDRCEITSHHAHASHVEGMGTKIDGASEQHVQGRWNAVMSKDYAHVVGNGTGDTDDKRSNAHTLDWNGVGWFAGGLKVGGTGQDDAEAVEVALKTDIPSIPTVSTEDAGKFLRVSTDGKWVAESIANAEGASF